MRVANLYRLFPAAILAVLMAPTANAALFRAYVSSAGNDANPCTLVAPCRLLPAAHAAVDVGGEIWMLDSANYNTSTVAVTKSVSILAIPGAVGSLLAIGGPAVNIATAGIKVSFRNIVFAPLPSGGGTHGVNLSAASTLLVENSVFANLPGNGIVALGGGAIVRVVNSIMRNNTSNGVIAQDGPTVSIVGTQILENGNGVTVVAGSGATSMSVSDSTITGSNQGVTVLTLSAGASGRAIVTRTTLDANATALDSESPGGGIANIQVSGSMISGGTFAWFQSGSGATVTTLGNNHFANSVGSGVRTPASLQ